jgi:predicted transcriptional regulator of viral defense system
MLHDQRSALSGYVSGLLSAGRTVFTAEEAEQALGVGRGAFLDAAERLQRRKALLNPRQGFYVVVPPQFASWGAPPPAWYIDALMRYERQAYYVGLLKAAELHGATHQAVMEFQVISAKRLPKIRAGRNLIVFYFRKDMEAVKAGIEDRKTDTGTMKISSAALTALDLLRYPRASGGIDNVATVLSDLGQKIHPEQLAAISVTVERPIVQRLGHLLDRLGHGALSGPMLKALRARGSVPWTELDRQEARDVDFAAEPRERDSRWRIIVRRAPEPDE